MKNKDQPIPEIIIEHIKSLNGDESIRKYTKGQFLGKGGFAKCYEVMEQDTGLIWACKAIAKASLVKPKHHLKLRSEIKIHSELVHENIVKFERSFEDDDFHYLLMELCTNQSLKELLKRRKRLTEIEAQYYIFQIVAGLKYTHSHLVIHRDIKLGNLYLTSTMLLKIGDFGLAAKLESFNQRRKTICCTPNYIAPEVLEQKEGHSFEADIWSIGVILYALLIGKPPFESQNVKHTYKKIKMNSYTFPETPIISQNAENLIRKLLTSNPSKRITLDEIYQHEFMTSRQIPKRLPPITMTNVPPEAFLQKYLVSDQNIIQPVKAMEMTYQFLPKQKRKDSGVISTAAKLKLTPAPSTIVKVNNLALTMRPFTSSKNINIGQNRNNNKIQASVNSVKPQTPAIPSTISTTINATSRQANQLSYLERWKDLTEKYGILYILSNGLYGMFYNDLTNIIVNPITMKATYLDLKKKNEKANDKIVSNLNIFPENLNKKVKIFKLYMKTLIPIDKPEKDSITESEEFLKSFAKTKHGFLFRISNGITQMGFIDNSAIVINYKQNTFIYLSKQGIVSSSSLQTNILSISDSHALKRLKYTLNLINSLKGSTNND